MPLELIFTFFHQALSFPMRSRNFQSTVVAFLSEFCFYRLLLLFLSLFVFLTSESVVSLVYLNECWCFILYKCFLNLYIAFPECRMIFPKFSLTVVVVATLFTCFIVLHFYQLLQLFHIHASTLS